VPYRMEDEIAGLDKTNSDHWSPRQWKGLIFPKNILLFHK